MKNILVTGGAGFIGSNFIRHMLSSYSYNIINLDLLTYAGNLTNLSDIEKNKNYTFVKGDICNRNLVENLFDKYAIDTVINFAAETHVDRSIEDPDIFLETNVLGTQTLLHAAKNAWKENSEDQYSRTFNEGVRFLQVSTDEVYGSLGEKGKFTEKSPLSPNSPYSASKASADLLVMAYYQTYGMPVNITRCSNNYGPFQFPDKLIPLAIRNSMKNKCIPIYGDGMQVRDWIHVKDHCDAIDKVIHQGVIGRIYNVGGNNEKTNLEIVKTILDYLNKSEDLISYVKDRPGHDRRYAIDYSRIQTELGWNPRYTFKEGITETINWYLRQYP
ncbi:MAG: dTDP-glucose 4,6-dehydratase [Peptococcaceae bacterium]|nr:dTDP-glucose 4,6-dehydratase [Peptococcaceae bacterium]